MGDDEGLWRLDKGRRTSSARLGEQPFDDRGQLARVGRIEQAGDGRLAHPALRHRSLLSSLLDQFLVPSAMLTRSEP
jgi:hypothetical protein